MPSVIVLDASSCIDLGKGGLRSACLKLDYRFLMPMPILEELREGSEREWRLWGKADLAIFDLPPELTKAVYLQPGSPSIQDKSCLVTAQYHDGILLSGDRSLVKLAKAAGVESHGVFWILEQLQSAQLCSRRQLITALKRWRNDPKVHLLRCDIDARLHRLGASDLSLGEDWGLYAAKIQSPLSLTH